MVQIQNFNTMNNVVLETFSGEVSGKCVRGINLICSTISGKTSCYLYNAHGDVVQLASDTEAVTKSYDYSAFGNETEPYFTLPVSGVA